MKNLWIARRLGTGTRRLGTDFRRLGTRTRRLGTSLSRNLLIYICFLAFFLSKTLKLI